MTNFPITEQVRDLEFTALQLRHEVNRLRAEVIHLRRQLNQWETAPLHKLALHALTHLRRHLAP